MKILSTIIHGDSYTCEVIRDPYSKQAKFLIEIYRNNNLVYMKELRVGMAPTTIAFLSQKLLANVLDEVELTKMGVRDVTSILKVLK